MVEGRAAFRGAFGGPYYRFPIYSRLRSHQHGLLLNRETRYPDVKKREAAVLAGPLSSYPVLSVGHARAAELMADFRDAHHLTRTGAARFSAMLAELPEFRAMANAARVSATTSR